MLPVLNKLCALPHDWSAGVPHNILTVALELYSTNYFTADEPPDVTADNIP